MLGRIKKYRRYQDFYAVKCFEVRAAIIITYIFVTFLFVILDFYGSFYQYQEMLQQILIVVIGGEFTLLGMSLAGMAIITAMFSPEMIKVISRVDKKDTINRVLSQFEFSALNLGIHLICLLLVLFALASDKEIINFPVFIVFFTILSYYFFFNLFYVIALIGNCIKINEIKNICNSIESIDKPNISIANELRIDYILAILLKERGISRELFLKDLLLMIEQSNIQEKQKVKDYLISYYKRTKE